MNAYISIILLNWNSEKDTQECLQSLLSQDYSQIKIILIDNASEENSRQFLLDFLDSVSENKEEFTGQVEKYGSFIEQILKYKLNDIELYFIWNKVNLGFAKANNLGIVFDQIFLNSEYLLLLNNDTVVDKRFLSIMVEYFKKDPKLKIATPVIYYYDKPDIIHNAGGKIIFPARRKYFTTLPERSVKRITFITGCAMFARSELFNEIGLLSEKFFFGEEDFEFSYRLKKNQIPAVVIRDSKIYHKVSTSSEKFFQKEFRKSIIYAINRLVDMKDYYPKWYWRLWKWLLLIYFLFLFYSKYNIPVRNSLGYIKFISNISESITEVPEDLVKKINLGKIDVNIE